MGKKIKGGEITLRDSEIQYELSGQKSEILAQYDLPQPEHTEYLWQWFQQISNKRTCGMSLNPLQPCEIESWFRQRRITPEPWELDAIDELDAAYLLANQPDK